MPGVPAPVAGREEREMRYEEFEVMQTRFNDLDRRLQLVLLRWGVSLVAFLIWVRLFTAKTAFVSLLSLSPTSRKAVHHSPPPGKNAPRLVFFLARAGGGE